MRHKCYIGTHEVSIETERKITHLLVGQLDEEAARPKELLAKEGRLKMAGPRTEEKPTLEEIIQLQAWYKLVSSGGFEPKPLDWCESLEQAIAAQAEWPNYINFVVVPVNVHLRT